MLNAVDAAPASGRGEKAPYDPALWRVRRAAKCNGCSVDFPSQPSDAPAVF